MGITYLSANVQIIRYQNRTQKQGAVSHKRKYIVIKKSLNILEFRSKYLAKSHFAAEAMSRVHREPLSSCIIEEEEEEKEEQRDQTFEKLIEA